MTLRRSIVIGCVLAASIASYSGSKADEAISLLRRAKELSDIHAEGAPAFVLKSRFRLMDGDKVVADGTYSENFVSKNKRRSELSVGRTKKVTVVSGSKRWVQADDATDLAAMSIPGFPLDNSAFWEENWSSVKGVKDVRAGANVIRCVELNRSQSDRQPRVCFAKETGEIALIIFREHRDGKTFQRNCSYGDYRKFGNKILPFATRCYEGGKQVYEERIESLELMPSPDEALFGPLKDATELPNCPVRTVAPHAVYSPDPDKPKHSMKGSYTVVLQGFISEEGKIQKLRVKKSVNPDYDASALESVWKWKFTPATCEGKPIGTQIEIELNFLR